MHAHHPSDSLHRLVKHAIDTGAAASIEDAQAQFAGYRLALSLDEGQARDPTAQATLLTSVALARRVFLGGVSVYTPPELPLEVPLPLGGTLGDAVRTLGGHLVGELAEGMPLIEVGGAAGPRRTGFHVRTFCSGWAGGVAPAGAELLQPSSPAMVLSSMLAAGMAVSEAYFHVRGETPVAGRRVMGLSLWRPDIADGWMAEEGPSLQFLPSKLWLIGLGHLGQAYLWALGLLPYPEPSGLELVLQDIDRITPSTESTSILSDASLVGLKKTRAMAAWAERRGFSTRLQERLFDPSFTRQESEPPVALCGLDNALGRRALDRVGFKYVVEAGLGRGHNDFRMMRLHTLPGARSAAEIWGGRGAEADVTDQPAYKKLLADGRLDQCGVTLLAGVAVGAPFVGAVAASLAVSEILRLLHGGRLTRLIDLDLQGPEHRTVVLRGDEMSSFNPGFVAVVPAVGAV